MAIYSRAQFYVQVLDNLGSLALGQDVEAEDRERIDLGAGAAFDALEKEGIYGARGEYQQDQIVGAAFHGLARYVANEIGRPYGVPYSDDVRISAENALRRAFSVGPSYAVQQVDYF